MTEKLDWEVEKFSETKTISTIPSPSIEKDWIEEKSLNTKIFTNSDSVQFIIEMISTEFKAAHHSKYEPKKAELTASLCLEAQKQLAEFLSDSELLSKEKKSEVERIESERYFYYKENKKSDEKMTDVALNRLVAKDSEVVSAKKEQYQAEADFNKYKNLFGVLKDAHIFFRGLAKGNNEWG